MADSVLQFWTECFIWARDILWEVLWDPTAFVILLVVWLGLVLKNWHQLGWVHAGWMLFERIWLAMKALLWPAVVLVIILLVITMVIAPAIKYRDLETEYQKLSKQSTTPHPVVKDEESIKTIGELRQQLNERNFDIQELKRLIDKAEQTASRSASDNAALNNKLRDLQGKLADKVTRQTHMEKLAAFLDTGDAIKRKCFSGSDVPRNEAVEWHDQVLNYLKTTMDSAHVIRFKNTREPDARSRYILPDGKPVARACNDNAQDVELKLQVLRDFLSELSK